MCPHSNSGIARINQICSFTGPISFIGRPELDTKLVENQAPIDLSRFVVRSLTGRGETVLDLYGGVGTTTTAAIYEGRNAIYVDRDLGLFTTARARVTKLMDTEAAKATFLNVQRGGDLDEGAKKAAEQYAKGAMLDPSKASEAMVDELLAKFDQRDAFTTMSETWQEEKGVKMSPAEVRLLVRAWLLSLDKGAFESISLKPLGAAVMWVSKLDPMTLQKTCTKGSSEEKQGYEPHPGSVSQPPSEPSGQASGSEVAKQV